MSTLSIVVGLLAAVGAFLVVFGTIRQPKVDLLDARLAVYDEPTTLKTIDELELERPLSERILRPILDRFGARLASMQPADRAQRLQELLNLAGRPLGLNPSGFAALQIVTGLAGAVLFGLLSFAIGVVPILGGVFGLALGYIAPQFLLKRAVTKKQKEIALALPNALDLLCISVEAGLGFDAALSRVVEKFDNALTREFATTLNEIRLGRPRMEALEDLGRRPKVDELNAFIQALVQSEQLGVGIARVLRIQSEDLRRKRRQKAEATAQQASLKMLFPMVGCIFPCIFLVILGPAVVHVLFHVN